jgi:hypothetical protein
MRIVRPNDPDYNKDRQIANARFDLKPAAIYYCDCQDDVINAIAAAHNQHLPVRIRSGGHQHEGMCSGDGVLMIDISGIKKIDPDPHDPNLFWIGAGARLKDIYATLWQKMYMFSGGGCSDVHVGGLAQGGGWGPVARKYGLTCDTLVAADIVMADGTPLTVTLESAGHHRALLWSLRGGGGGNFGVVTRYCFRVAKEHTSYTDLLLSWRDVDFDGKPVPDLDQFILHWTRTFPQDDDRRLTTFLRLSVVKDATSDRVVIGGRFLGNEASARLVLARLLHGQAPPHSATYSPSMDPISIASASPEADAAHWDRVGRALGTLPGYQPGPALTDRVATESAAPGAPTPDLSDTCAGVPLRHKISSGFARRDFDMAAVRLATRIIKNTPYQDDARQYVSFHSLGGAISEQPQGGNAFAFRDRHFLLQYQAWWLPKAGILDPICIKWIDDFRRAMKGGLCTDGAFINFVDRDIPVAEYYAQNFPTLRDVKAYWDKGYFFRFGLSIPPAGVDA